MGNQLMRMHLSYTLTEGYAKNAWDKADLQNLRKIFKPKSVNITDNRKSPWLLTS